MDLNPNLGKLFPDPIRTWVHTYKDLGVKHMLTIGVPDPLPQGILELYSKAIAEDTVKGNVSYPPTSGIDTLKESIIEMETRFGVNLTPEDSDRLFISVGGSMGLYFCFQLFKPGSEVIMNMPVWGTIFNMIACNGLKAVPTTLFENGKFVEENANAVLSEKTQAVYLNMPSNPVCNFLSPAAISDFANWAVSNGLQIVSDSPYKYLIYDKKNLYTSPLNLSDDINQYTNIVSSFSKIIKPDIRLGFIRVSPSIMADPAAENIFTYYRNLSAGTPRSIQIGTRALLNHDPNLSFLDPIVQGYKEKAGLVQKYLSEMGCECEDTPDAGYYVFPKTPNGENGEAFVRRMAKDYGIGFVPGSSFGGNISGFEHIGNHFRVGFGGGWTKEKLSEIFESCLK